MATLDISKIKGLRILVIEDDTVSRIFLRELLTPTQAQIDYAKSGYEATQYMAKNSPPDIILLDIQMPEMDGAEALKLIREDEASKSTPVIILTNIGEEEAPSEMKALNVHSYIVKANYTPRQVVALVKSTIKDLV